MNENTFNTLEYGQLVAQIERHCISAFGRERLAAQRPVMNIKTVEKRLAETTEARRILDANSHVPFIGVSAMEPVIMKLEKEMMLDADELTIVAEFLRGSRKLRRFMEEQAFFAPLLSSYAAGMSEHRGIEEAITSSIQSGRIVTEASKELKRIRKQLAILEARIDERLQKFIRNPHHKEMLQETYVTKKNDRFTVPIKASYKSKVAGAIIDMSSRGTTLFVEPDTVSKQTDEWMITRTEEQVEEYQILATLTGSVFDVLPSLRSNIDLIAHYDLVIAKGKHSQRTNGVAPRINDEGRVHLKRAVHPLLENGVPLDLTLGESYRGLVITGPNAGGKTVVMKTVGLLTLAVMSGFHIQADPDSEIALFEKVFVDMGDQQSIGQALSTFSGHMQNVSNIVRQMNQRTLLLFDELGSGTEPNEGAALAIAILEACYKRGALTIVSTHYGEIKDYSERHPEMMNAAMQFDPETLEPKYRLLIGQSGESNALFIARRMKLPDSVLKAADSYMRDKEYDFSPVDPRYLPQLKVEKMEKLTEFKKGDRVRLLETGEVGLVRQEIDRQQRVEVYLDGKSESVSARRLVREARAEDLYPAGYDIDSLFTTYRERKDAHDFARGSKKALRRVEKEIRSRNR